MRNSDEDSAHVLVASPDTPYAATLDRFLRGAGYLTERCHDARGVLRLVGRKPFDVVLLDLALGNEGDVDLTAYVRRQAPQSKLILLFDMDRVDRAIEGVRDGAFFYLPRSCQPTDVMLVVGKAIRSLDTESAMHHYEKSVLDDMIGGAASMKRIVELVAKVAPTSSTVLLLGESGTGKELLANTIHRLSPRRDMPFIAVNCAALPEALLESEMFGHVRGAFTGADAEKPGLFEEADGGTLFLDEIGDMALITQAKLLRVLQNGEIRRVGSSVPYRVDVRVIAATHRDLEKAVKEYAFREDLYFRLNVVQIRIPPLRERRESIPRLVTHFVRRYNAQFNRDVQRFDDETWALLRDYAFPGNVRELESIVAHAVIMSDGPVVQACDLPDQVRYHPSPRLALPDYTGDDFPSIEEMEKRLIRNALDKYQGNQTEAARRLGISRSTLWRKLKEYGIPIN